MSAAPVAGDPATRVKPLDTPAVDAFARGPWLDQLTRVQRLVDSQLRRPSPATLDVGCGSSLMFVLPPGVHRTGIDLSALQLGRNAELDVKIQADVQEHELPADAYDVIFCWDLLEHLPQPELALERMRRALRPGGIVVIGVPNLFSPKGLATRLTPQGFHVWFYRRVMRSRTAGVDDVGPFATHLKYGASPRGLARFAARSGLQVEHLETYEGPFQRRLRVKMRLRGRPWGVVRAATLLLTGGVVDPGATDAVVVLRDPRPAREGQR